MAAMPAALPQSDQRPNIVFLLTDDQRWDSLGCMGNPVVKTLHIDRLSAQGVTFTNHFVTTSICVTSRASIFAGQHETTHGIHEFDRRFSSEAFAKTYPSLLRESGYRTGFIGKYGLNREPLPADRFDYWRGFPRQGRYFPEPGDKGPHLTRVMGDQAIEFLRTCRGDRPFFLQVSFKAPHIQDEDPRQFLYDPDDAHLYRDLTMPVPKTADPRFIRALPVELQRSEARRRWAVEFATPELFQASVKGYYRLITGIDRVVGRIAAQLGEQGLDGNTVIVYSSDNGFYLGEHGLAGKWFMHEESIRTPLIVCDPRFPAALRGARQPAMTLNIDIAPTLLRLAGIDAPQCMQGRDLTALFAPVPPPWRTEWFYEHHYPDRWLPKSEGVRTERWKYIRYIETRPVFEELYDLANDPIEARNLAGEKASRRQLERMRSRWEAWRKHLDAYSAGRPWREPPV
jgi:arylsulfatase A-like enzyme